MLGLIKIPFNSPINTSSRLFNLLPDIRSYYFNIWRNLNFRDLHLILYPQLLRVDDLLDNQEVIQEEITDDDIVEKDFSPNFQRLSNKNLSKKGIYLLDAAISKYLFVSSNANPEILREIMTPQQLQSDPNDILYLIPLETKLSKEIFQLTNRSGFYQNTFSPDIEIIRENSPYSEIFYSFLYEDGDDFLDNLDDPKELGISLFLSYIFQQMR